MPHLDLDWFVIGAVLAALVHSSWLLFLREPVRSAVCSWRMRRWFDSHGDHQYQVMARFNEWGGVDDWWYCSEDEHNQPWFDADDDWHASAWEARS